MSERRLYLGVDGGGTKTEFVCIDQERRIVATALGGTTYHLQVGFDGVVDTLAVGIAAIARELQASPADFAFAFFGLPAFGEDRLIDPQLAEACGRIVGHGRYRCGNDMVCGWAGSLDCADGINLVAGTGSIGYGERRGRAARAGGWGEVFSDEGSAYWIAIQGLNAFTRMSDGRLPRGPLHRRLVDALGLEDDLDLCARIMGPAGMPRDGIAALARIVSQAAADGDTHAAAILDEAGHELAAIAGALRTTLGFDPGETVLLSWSGGVLSHEPRVRHALERALASGGDYRIIDPRHPPGLGAAIYAAHLAAAEAAGA